MEKIINPCRTVDGEVFCKIVFKDGNLSITGVIGPKANGDANGSCGQIEMSFEEYYPPGERHFHAGWSRSTFDKFLSVWREWHLNDMQPGCDHQRNRWDISEKLILTDYTWTTKYYELRKKAERGDMNPEETEAHRCKTILVESVTIKHPRHKYESGTVKDLLAEGLIKEKSAETKSAGWVYPTEHPDGLLMKPCPDCGYKYGSAWLKKEVPESVIRFLFNRLPDSSNRPAWV